MERDDDEADDDGGEPNSAVAAGREAAVGGYKGCDSVPKLMMMLEVDNGQSLEKHPFDVREKTKKKPILPVWRVVLLVDDHSVAVVVEDGLHSIQVELDRQKQAMHGQHKSLHSHTDQNQKADGYAYTLLARHLHLCQNLMLQHQTSQQIVRHLRNDVYKVILQ